MRLKTVRRVVMLALVILTAPLIAEAQQPQNVPRIGLLITDSRAAESRSIEAFTVACKRLAMWRDKTS